MTLRQYELRNFGRKTTCWLDASYNLKVGDKITLRDADDDLLIWTVTRAYLAEIDYKDLKKYRVFESIEGRATKKEDSGV